MPSTPKSNTRFGPIGCVVYSVSLREHYTVLSHVTAGAMVAWHGDGPGFYRRPRTGVVSDALGRGSRIVGWSVSSTILAKVDLDKVGEPLSKSCQWQCSTTGVAELCPTHNPHALSSGTHVYVWSRPAQAEAGAAA